MCTPNGTGGLKIKAVHVDLHENKYSTHSVDETQLSRSEAFVEDSASSMLELLTNPALNEGMEDDFERLPEGSSACKRCRFRGDCGR